MMHQPSSLPGSGPQAYPLLASDPPKIGSFWLDARMTASRGAVVYFGHSSFGSEVLLLRLNAGAAGDAAVRDRLSGEINKMHEQTVIAMGGEGQNRGRLSDKHDHEYDDPYLSGEEVAPWVALAYDGSERSIAEANRLLRTIDLSIPVSQDAGPDYLLPWEKDASTGRWRVWPLPWPGRHDRAGVLPILAAWLMTIVLAGLGLLIAVLLFQNTPPEQPQPPVPTQNQSQSSNDPSQGESESSADQKSSTPDQGESGESQSASPQDSQSASPGEGETARESEDPNADPSKQPSMNDEGESSPKPTNGRTKL